LILLKYKAKIKAKVMNIKIKMYLLTMVTFLGTINPAISYSGILIPTDNLGVTKDVKITDTNKLFKELENYESYRPRAYRDLVSHPYTKDSKITDTNKLFKELENYESYRPDSYSDAVRSPFGEKRYKNLKIYN
jgi:hypothetical protein